MRAMFGDKPFFLIKTKLTKQINKIMRKTLDDVNQQTGLAQIIIIEDDWVYSECLKKIFQSYDANTVCYQYYSIAEVQVLQR